MLWHSVLERETGDLDQVTFPAIEFSSICGTESYYLYEI